MGQSSVDWVLNQRPLVRGLPHRAAGARGSNEPAALRTQCTPRHRRRAPIKPLKADACLRLKPTGTTANGCDGLPQRVGSAVPAVSRGGRRLEAISRGFRIHYVDEGTGPALVLLPGLLMSAARWRAIGYIDRFARDFRVLAVDPLGHGLSEKPHNPGSYRIEDCAADVLAVLDHATVDRAHVWGYSRGTSIAVALAASAPERVASLVIGGGSLHLRPQPRSPLPARSLEMVAALRAGDWGGFWTAMGIDDRETQKVLEAGQDRLAIAASIEGLALSSFFNIAFDPAVLLRPPLVYSGSFESSISDDRSEAAAAGAQFHEIPGRGHAGAFQDIVAVAPIVSEYLSRQAPRNA